MGCIKMIRNWVSGVIMDWDMLSKSEKFHTAAAEASVRPWISQYTLCTLKSISSSLEKTLFFPVEAPLPAQHGQCLSEVLTTTHLPKHFSEVCLSVRNFQPLLDNWLSSSCQFWQHDFIQTSTICSLKPLWCWLHQSRVTHSGWSSYCFHRETRSRLNLQITSPKRDAAWWEVQGMAVLFPGFHGLITWIGFIKQRNSRVMWEESRETTTQLTSEITDLMSPAWSDNHRRP